MTNPTTTAAPARCECGNVPTEARTEQGFYLGMKCKCGDYRPAAKEGNDGE